MVEITIFQSVIGFVSTFIDLLNLLNIYNQTIHFSIEIRFHFENFYNIFLFIVFI